MSDSIAQSRSIGTLLAVEEAAPHAQDATICFRPRQTDSDQPFIPPILSCDPLYALRCNVGFNNASDAVGNPDLWRHMHASLPGAEVEDVRSM